MSRTIPEVAPEGRQSKQSRGKPDSRMSPEASELSSPAWWREERGARSEGAVAHIAFTGALVTAGKVPRSSRMMNEAWSDIDDDGV